MTSSSDAPSPKSASVSVTSEGLKAMETLTGNMNAAGGKTTPKGDFRAAALYMLVSILLIFFNKATFSYYNFSAPNVLTLSQNICSIIFLIVCKQCKVLEFQDFSLHNLRKLIFLGLTFIAYMVFGMIAMKVVNIPMYTTLRRTTVVFVMFLEYIISRKSSTLSIKVSVGLMIVGALVAGMRDLNFNIFAYVIVVIYNLCTALYLVLINHISSQEKSRVSLSPGANKSRLDHLDYMFYNNLISIPMLIAIIYSTGEISDAIESPYWHDYGFLLAVFASSSLAFGINYTIFWNTSVNSALTQTVSGQAKDVVVVIIGFILFDDAHIDLINIIGIMIGFGGSIFYAFTKIIPWCTVEHLFTKLNIVALDKKKTDASDEGDVVHDALEKGRSDQLQPLIPSQQHHHSSSPSSTAQSNLFPHRSPSHAGTSHLFGTLHQPSLELPPPSSASSSSGSPRLSTPMGLSQKAHSIAQQAHTSANANSSMHTIQARI